MFPLHLKGKFLLHFHNKINKMYYIALPSEEGCAGCAPFRCIKFVSVIYIGRKKIDTTQKLII